MTRRVFMGALTAGAGVALPQEITSGDVWLEFLPEQDGKEFNVAVRWPQSDPCDWILVEVFYEQKVPGVGTLLRSQESLAPYVGAVGAGGTNKNFTMARAQVKFVQLTPFKAGPSKKVSVG